MDERTKKLKTGLFVSGALAILLVMLFYFGMSQVFVPKVPMYTTFTESVQGLNVGSEVKYRGVKIGTVRDISIHVEERVIKVDMDIDPKRFFGITGENKASREELFNAFIKEQMKKGLRCRLELSGITGMKYIDFDYYGKATKMPDAPLVSQESGEYIPSVSSSFKDIAGALTQVSERLSKVDFERISANTNELLQELRQLLNSGEVRDTLHSLQIAAENIKVSSQVLTKNLNSKNLEQLKNQLTANLQNFDRLLCQLSAAVKDMKLPETSEQFRRSANSVQELRMEFSNSLLYINAAAQELRRLCELLNQQPDALLRGKK